MQHISQQRGSLEAVQVELAADWTERQVCDKNIKIRGNLVLWSHQQLLPKPQKARQERFS